MVQLAISQLFRNQLPTRTVKACQTSSDKNVRYPTRGGVDDLPTCRVYRDCPLRHGVRSVLPLIQSALRVPVLRPVATTLAVLARKRPPWPARSLGFVPTGRRARLAQSRASVPGGNPKLDWSHTSSRLGSGSSARADLTAASSCAMPCSTRFHFPASPLSRSICLTICSRCNGTALFHQWTCGHPLSVSFTSPFEILRLDLTGCSLIERKSTEPKYWLQARALTRASRERRYLHRFPREVFLIWWP